MFEAERQRPKTKQQYIQENVNNAGVDVDVMKSEDLILRKPQLPITGRISTTLDSVESHAPPSSSVL